MHSEAVELDFWQIGVAASLVLVNGLISLFLRLGLERRLLVAAVRTVVQLLLIGVVLEWIFADQSWLVILGWMFVMTLIAGGSAARRAGHGYAGIGLDSLISIWSSSWLILAVALLAIVRPKVWYMPQYSIPILGMILGNTLNGISLGLDRLGEELHGKRDRVETLLALGATRWEAAREPIQQAIRTGMIPVINAMMVVGLVSLPGMMTGQILAGAEPFQAVMYQIVIMFLIAAGTSTGATMAILLAYLRLFNHDHQFLAARLTKRSQ
ncbi:MAG: iron export ABC transporter permease subunit FetB [Pirellulaceae bacterium]